MKLFDYVIGNPPYQEEDGGSGASARPVYHYFVQQAIEMGTKCISLIMPAKWYSGGKGLDEFRNQMLNDTHLRVLVDYTDSQECFDHVDIAGGLCYFIWDRDYSGMCKCTNIFRGESTTTNRYLNEFNTFVRYPLGNSIIRKVRSLDEATMDTVVTARKPFGLATNVKPTEKGDLILRYNKGYGKYRRKDITVGVDNIDKWKVMISYLSAEHAGQPDKMGMFRILSTTEILPPKSVCTETYLLAGCYDTEEEANNQLKYLKTKFLRFLVWQIAVSQHITRNSFSFVPVQNVLLEYADIDWSKSIHEIDLQLYRKYGLDEQEIEFIETHVKEMA